MRRLMAFVLGGLPTTPAATRAFAATMADWRHEAETAGTATRRLRVATVGVLSVARVLIVSGIKELPLAWSSPFLWRTALMSCVILLGAIWYDPPLRFVDVLGTRDLIVLALFRAAPAAVMLLPLAAFLSEALGSRDRVAPSLGALTAMAFIAAVALMLYPEFIHYGRYVTWEHFANAATPAPRQLPIQWASFGVGLMLAIVAVSLSVLAFQVRTHRSITSWLLGVAPFVLVSVVT